MSLSVSELNQQKIQDFKDGKINIKKDELLKSVKDEVVQGKDVSSELMDLVDSYDKIDKNGDGISYDEYTTYKNTPSGLISSLGLSALSSINTQPSLLNYLSFDDSSDSSVFTGSESSYFNNLIQGYSSSSTVTNTADSSFVDYLT